MNSISKLARKLLVVTVLSLIGSPALAAGTIPLALSVQTDKSGNIAAGCLLYTFQAGSVATPQNSYSDFSLTQPLPNPITCDQSGRLPMFWLADGLVHARLTDSSGVVIFDSTLQTLGPSSGSGGGGSTVDPTTILSTGDIKTRYSTGPLSGFVRANGLTIGNSTSGASERANADTQALFIFLYSVDPNLAVSGGRTGNALNDYNASKTIALPDWRGKNITALADMGNTASPVLTSTYAGCNNGVTTLGSACGAQSHTQIQAELPAVSPTFSGIASGQAFAVSGNSAVVQFGSSGPGGSWIQSLNLVGTSAPSGTISALGSGNPFTIVPPLMLATIYLKL